MTEKEINRIEYSTRKRKRFYALFIVEPTAKIAPGAALADLAEVSVNTIRNMEATGSRPVGGFESTRSKVQTALENMGMEFTNGDSPGVRFVKTRKGKKKV